MTRKAHPVDRVFALLDPLLRSAALAVEAHDATVRGDRRGISMFDPDGQPVARLRNLGKDGWEVLWWSHCDKWESIGDVFGVVYDSVDEALAYVLDDPMGILW